MKKCACFLVCALLLLSLFACGTPEEKTGLQAGFGRVDITPGISVPLSGYGNTETRMSQGCLDSLYATCVAVTDMQDNTVLLITTDMLGAWDYLTEEVRQLINRSTGVPESNIMIAATHTHSAPDMASSYDNGMATYKLQYKLGLLKAAEEAMADRSTVTMEAGSTQVEGMNFVRHYLMNDGTYFGDNFGSMESGIKDHASEADSQMQLLRFVRTSGEKQDILLINWQGHPKMASTAETADGKQTRPMLSADYIGALRTELERQANVQMAFFLGASGNLNVFSKIPGENKTTNYWVFGQLLTDTVTDCLENSMTPVEGATVAVARKNATVQIDHTEDHLLPYAAEVYDLWTQTNSYSACTAMGVPNGVMSPYHAASILTRSKIIADTEQLECNAIRIGNIGFVTAPYEMFDTNGMYIKDNSPFATTFVLSCTNDYNNYIASEQAFTYGSYEVHNRRYVRGTAEALADELLELLNTVK